MSEAKNPKRPHVEMSILISVLVFVVGLAFNAGRGWDKQVNMEKIQGKHGSQLNSLRKAVEHNRNDTQARLVRIETLLQAMHQSQTDIQHKLDKTK